MYEAITIPIKEHETCSELSEEELIVLLKNHKDRFEEIDTEEKKIRAGYYIGLFWLSEYKYLHIRPKLDNVDYLKMLSIGLSYPGAEKHADNIFEIDFNKPAIKIDSQQDILTPLIIVSFLQVVKNIVRKGLKRDYYRTEQNFYGRVKGKVLVSKTLKNNTFKNKYLNLICQFNEFTINQPENRIIKKALLFSSRYLKTFHGNNNELEKDLRYILPAFVEVDETISTKEIKKIQHNHFFPEYSKAIELAITILQRFAFNINSIEKNIETEIPPFWINLPLIFELFVLGKLKEAFGGKNIIYQPKAKYGNPDFLHILPGKEIIIDAKYKPSYDNGYDIEDIRQLSAYARDRGILNKLKIKNDCILDCLIIYPDQNAGDSLEGRDLFACRIDQFYKFYKIGIAVPKVS